VQDEKMSARIKMMLIDVFMKQGFDYKIVVKGKQKF
jgi:hypothetical protein